MIRRSCYSPFRDEKIRSGGAVPPISCACGQIFPHSAICPIGAALIKQCVLFTVSTSSALTTRGRVSSASVPIHPLPSAHAA